MSGCYLSAQAAEFYPVTAVTNTNSSNFFAKDNLIQGSGVGFDAVAPHDQLGTGGGGFTWVTDAPGADYYDFFPAPILWFDLGSDVALIEISTWGYADSNTNGAKDFSLRFATDADGSAGFGTSITYNPSFEAGFNYGPRDSNVFSQTISARYVEMTITDNWRGFQGGTAGGDRVGLGEVAFEKNVVTDGPDISVAAELLLGALDHTGITEFSVAVTNVGDEPLVISSIGQVGPNASAFTSLAGPPTIDPESSRGMPFEFDPSGLGGPISMTLTLNSNDPDTPAAEVLITGTLPELGQDISVPASVVVDETGMTPLTVTVANIGRAALALTDAVLSGPQADALSVTTVPAEVVPLGTADIIVTFDPADLDSGPVSATLTISSDDPDTPVVEVAIGGGVPESFYPISSVSSATESVGADFYSAQNLIQGSGAGFDSGWPHDALGDGGEFTWVTDQPNGGAGDYFEPLPAVSPIMVFDLGEDVVLDEISFWGYADTNANGANLFSLRFATSAEGPTGFGMSIDYNPMFAPAQPATPRQTFEFEEAVLARYVEWVPLDNFFGINPPGGDRVGAGEVAFPSSDAVVGDNFQVTEIELIDGYVHLTFNSRPLREYSVWRSTDLRQSPWEELTDSYPSQGDETVFVDDDLPPGATRVFYQVRPGL